MKQALLRAALPSGQTLALVVLIDGRCAILREQELLYSGAADATGIDEGVKMFIKLSRLNTDEAPG